MIYRANFVPFSYRERNCNSFYQLTEEEKHDKDLMDDIVEDIHLTCGHVYHNTGDSMIIAAACGLVNLSETESDSDI